MSVTPQIDVTGTAVSGLNFFCGGLRVLTASKVHPAAIEAALQLGKHLYVSLHHTGDAVDALGGASSYQLQVIRSASGDNSGELLRILRESPSSIALVQFLAAVKSYILDETSLLEILHKLLVQSGVLETVLVSRRQLGQLVQKLEIHKVDGSPLLQYLFQKGEKLHLLPQTHFVETMLLEFSQLALKVIANQESHIIRQNNLSNPSDPTRLLKAPKGASLILKICEGLKSPDVLQVIIIGWKNALGLAQALNHMSINFFSIYYEQKLV
jgi:hypothetical protein